MAVDRPDLDALIAKWQPSIAPHWDVKAVYSRRWNMTGGVHGYIVPNRFNRQAHVSIMEPADRDETLWPVDVERNIVHELCHLIFYDLEDAHEGMKFRAIPLENAVEAFALALILADRNRADRSLAYLNLDDLNLADQNRGD